MKIVSKLKIIIEAIFSLIVLVIILISLGYLYSWYNCKSIYTVALKEWQQLATISYGAFGIVLGYLYFKSKIIIDRGNARKDRIRNRLMYINEELHQADKLIEQILNFHIDNKNELDRIRSEIDKKFMLLTNNYLEHNVDLIGFEDKELNSIVAVHSFFTHSHILYIEEYYSLRVSDRSQERLKYLDVFQEATTICIQKLENL